MSVAQTFVLGSLLAALSCTLRTPNKTVANIARGEGSSPALVGHVYRTKPVVPGRR